MLDTSSLKSTGQLQHAVQLLPPLLLLDLGNFASKLRMQFMTECPAAWKQEQHKNKFPNG
jgi:hypothetical protein